MASLINLILNSQQLVYSGLSLAGLFGITWVYSFIKRDASIDLHVWRLGFVFQAILYYLESPVLTWQKSLFAFLSLFHSLRLATYLFIRDFRKPENRRYTTLLRQKLGNNLDWLSLFILFIPQMILNWIVGLSIFAVEVAKDMKDVSNFYFLFGCFTMLCGTLIESLADIQLYNFKQDPRNEGKIMDRGLWKYSRHPNYFGEALHWWGVYMCNLSIGVRVTIFAPLIMTIATRFITGVPFTELYMEKKFGEKKMQDYKETTSAVIPSPFTNQQAQTNTTQYNPQYNQNQVTDIPAHEKTSQYMPQASNIPTSQIFNTEPSRQ
jgi:steroid 5-alpha reductase family enzyme